MAIGKVGAGRAEAEQTFWSLAAALLARPGVTRSTMMGFPCLRVEGRFFASFDRRTDTLVIKLAEADVAALLAAGEGLPFAPNGRVFREWVAISAAQRPRWPDYLERAWAFIGGIQPAS